MIVTAIHWVLIGFGILATLAFFGLLIFAGNDGVVLCPPWIKEEATTDKLCTSKSDDQRKVQPKNPFFRMLGQLWFATGIFLGFAYSGAMLLVCAAVLSSPTLFFKFVLGWSWDYSAFPGVITGIVLVIFAIILYTIRENRKLVREQTSEKPNSTE